MSKISPEEWLATANLRRPPREHVSPWYSGRTRPKTIGWYERHFESSKNYEMHKSSQWWDGAHWLLAPGGGLAKEQVGAYPSWRGLTREIHIGDDVTLIRGSRRRTSGPGCERRIKARLDSIDCHLNVFCTLLEDDPLATTSPYRAGQSGLWHGLSFLAI